MPLFSTRSSQTTHWLTLLLLGFVILLTVMSRGVRAEEPLKIAYYPDRVPWMYQDAEGEPVGVAIELWKKWSQVNHKPIKFIVSTPEQVQNQLNRGEVNVLAYLPSNQNPVLEDTDSVVIYPYSPALFVKKSEDTFSFQEALQKLPLGYLSGYGFFDALKAESQHADLQAFTSYIDMMTAAVSDEISGFLGGHEPWSKG